MGGYQGIIYPVNPRASSVHGVKEYPPVSDVPDEIDLAVLIMPAEHVASIVEECACKKTRRLMTRSWRTS